MKSFRSLLSLALVAGFAIGAWAAPLQDEGQGEVKKVDITLDLPILSKYVFRGAALNQSGVFQPSLSLQYMGWGAYIWGNLEMREQNLYPDGYRKGRFTEQDTCLAYTGKYKYGTWTAGFCNYQYPGTGSKAYDEVYASTTLNMEYSPTLTLYYGTNVYHGVYGQLSGSKEWKDLVKFGPDKAASLVVNAWIGMGDKEHNQFIYGADGGGFTDFGVSAKLNYPVAKNVNAYVGGTYTLLLDHRMTDGGFDRCNLIGSLGVSYKF